MLFLGLVAWNKLSGDPYAFGWATDQGKHQAMFGRDARLLDKWYRIHARRAFHFMEKQMSKTFPDLLMDASCTKP